jgi:hypothetical protein
VPTGFKPDGTKAFAVKGHLFRLNPSVEDQESADCVSEELIEPEYPSRKQRQANACALPGKLRPKQSKRT